MIVNCEDRCKGSINICKFLRERNGKVVKPKDGCYKVCVQGCNINMCFLLSKSNNYCVSIDNLCNGRYEVFECDSRRAEYVVNGRCTSREAIVIVDDDTNDVHVINNGCCRGSLKICKYMYDPCDGRSKPCNNERFEVEIRSYNFYEVITLCKDNNYCYVLKDLPFATYEIRELGTNCDVVYCINERMHRRGIITIDDNDRFEVDILNCYENERSFKLCLQKYVCIDEQLVRPDNCDSFTFRLNGCEEEITLNACNDFKKCIMLDEGKYCIKEECYDDKNIEYRLNGKKLECNTFNLCKDSKLDIINFSDSRGSLKICARTSGRCRDNFPSCPVKVTVEGKNYFEQFMLTRENDFCKVISDLEDGWYCINRVGSHNCDNNEYGCNCDNDCRKNCDERVFINGNCVDVILNVDQNNYLSITKFIDSNGEYVKPLHGSYRIEISKDNKKKTIVLDENNSYNYILSPINDGTYKIRELDSQNEVRYEVNGREVYPCIVRINCNSAEVSVINSMTSTSRLQISKYIEVDNELIVPETSEEFLVLLNGMNTQEIISLNQNNDFIVTLDDLEVGIYTIEEVAQEYYTTYYIVNGERIYDPVFDIDMSSDNEVMVINVPIEPSNNAINVMKIVRHGSTSSKPELDEVFEFMLVSENFNEVYRLDQYNNWYINVGGLANGEYELFELDPQGYEVMYKINNGVALDDCHFSLYDNDVVDIDIINKNNASMYVDLVIEKRIRNECGNLVRPRNNEEFKILITGDEYHQSISLNNNNDFKVKLNNLRSGTYTIREKYYDGYEASYILNDELETSDDVFTLVEDSKLIVINYKIREEKVSMII